jgi:integrase
MAAKVRWMQNAWWVVTHHQGRRRKKRVGTTKADKRQAEEIVRKVNGQLALGILPVERTEEALPCDAELRRWITAYAPTFKPSTQGESRRIIETHLVPFFGSRDVRELRESDLLKFVQVKLEAGLAPKTIRNTLSILRRVLNLLHREGQIDRNPASRLGELMRRVDKSAAREAKTADSWSREEIETPLEIAHEHERRFHPPLATLFYAGLRRGELLGLKWEDVDFERRRLHIRRAYVKGSLTSPKSGRGRFVAIAPGLGALLLDVLAERRRECLTGSWADVPEWVFPSNTGGLWDQDNFERCWRRVRRRAQKEGVRPLRLHCTRHTWASLALQAGKSVRWVADQLGHADPAMTLRVYAHVIPDDEPDLSFLDFSGSQSGLRRPYTAPDGDDADPNKSAPAATDRGVYEFLARPARLERAERAVHGEPVSAVEIPDLAGKYGEIARIGLLGRASFSDSGPSRGFRKSGLAPRRRPDGSTRRAMQSASSSPMGSRLLRLVLVPHRPSAERVASRRRAGLRQSSRSSGPGGAPVRPSWVNLPQTYPPNQVASREFRFWKAPSCWHNGRCWNHGPVTLQEDPWESSTRCW